ncbi:unnamed protein product [Lampetra planeri]
MSTRRRIRTRTSDDEEEDLIPQTALEDGGEALPAGQGAVRPCDTSPLAGMELRAALRQVAASILADLQPADSAVVKGAAELLKNDDSAAILARRKLLWRSPRSLPPLLAGEERAAHKI